jgi:hypothetical protein
MLRKTIGQLQGLAVANRRLALFSGSETGDNKSTESLRALPTRAQLSGLRTDRPQCPYREAGSAFACGKGFCLSLFVENNDVYLLVF